MKLSKNPRHLTAAAVSAVLLSGCSFLKENASNLINNGHTVLEATPHSTLMLDDAGRASYIIHDTSGYYTESVDKVIAPVMLRGKYPLFYREEEVIQDEYRPSAELIEMVGNLASENLASLDVPQLRGLMPVENFRLEGYGSFSTHGTVSYPGHY